jgi:hypothetical protein
MIDFNAKHYPDFEHFIPLKVLGKVCLLYVWYKNRLSNCRHPKKSVRLSDATNIYMCYNPRCNEKLSLRFLKDIFELGFTAFVVLADCRCEEMLAKNKTVDRGDNFQRTGWWYSQLVCKKCICKTIKRNFIVLERRLHFYVVFYIFISTFYRRSCEYGIYT